MNICLKLLLLFFLFNIILKDYKEKSKKRIIRDVLFINGCHSGLPHPYRYRVLHQIEQLNAANLDCFDIYYLDLFPHIVLDFRIVILYRCPWTKQIYEAIKLAKSLNKRVLFDIDDLVIDTKYTNIIPYVKNLSDSEKKLYDNGVIRIGKTLKLCEGVITTTKILAEELKKYVKEVYINRNTASEEMFKLSQKALKIKTNFHKRDELVIGYFSGSITHNSDIDMVIPVFIKILKEFKNVKLFFLGELDIPKDLTKFSSQIIKKKFVNWKKLPEYIASVDINIAPIEENIFNAAKSENKWVEASLVKVPTIASNFGAFKEIVNHGVTGLLCTTKEDWYKELKTLILDENMRKVIGNNAFEFCRKEYNTVKTGYRLANYLNLFGRKHIGFIIPSFQISGGIRVILVHCSFLQEKGYDVDLIVPNYKNNIFEFQGHKFNVISLNTAIISCQYDVLVGTLYTTLTNVINYPKARKRLYLVQNYETDFNNYGNYLRLKAEKTYNLPFDIKYITISKWCQKWLIEKYGHNAAYAPNGINLNYFKAHKRNLNKQKIIILIEGDNYSPYKNVDESFKIVEKLDKNKFEIWYMSYKAKPKSWYRVDKFLNKIPYEKVGSVYGKCDILIKSSWLESFSLPPLEMMATGGYCIVAHNSGNEEYLKNEENCLLYKIGDIDSAFQCIEKLILNENLQNKLYENGLATAKKRNWEEFKDEILALYED